MAKMKKKKLKKAIARRTKAMQKEEKDRLEKSFYIAEHDEIHIVRLENWRTPIFRTAIKLF
ncbi:hypothetical protein [Bacillus thuringiensis]|uniref:hypothetical protein n=1 Tax=Bacillus thuringiensis TaxID=1428 RepID=UPI00115571C2|nr:hypothetical protein [Bacillus thuringiensis]EKS8366179.1 hypothetical protein [Bacillus cereus]